MHLLLPLLQSKYEDKIADKLSAQGLDNEWELGSSIAKAGFDILF